MWNANWTELYLELKNEGWSVISTFVKSVDWTEKWIGCIFGILAIWCIMILVYRFGSLHWFIARDNVNFQLAVFIIDSCIVFGGRTINRLGGCFRVFAFTPSRYWKYFASKNYFDEDGMFFSFMVSFPLLILTAVQTVVLYAAADV